MSERAAAVCARLAPWRWPAWAWLALMAVVFTLRFPVNFALYPPFLMDFEVYRAIARRVLEGHALHLYDPTTSERMIFKYAPIWAVLMTPLGWLSVHAGGIAWALVCVVALIVTSWAADRLCRRIVLNPPGWLAPASIGLLVRPLTSGFLLGQSDVVWAALVAMFLRYDDQDRPWRASLWLALAMSLKLPALLFLPYLVVRRRWAMLTRVFAWLAGLNVAAAILLVPYDPMALFVQWQRALRTNASAYAFDIGNQSLLAMAGRLLRADGYGFNVLALNDAAVTWITLAVQAGLFALLLWWPWRGEDHLRRLLDGSVLMVFMAVFSPSCWVATYGVLLLPTCVALALAIARPWRLWRRLAVTLGLLAVVACSVMTHSNFWRAIGMRQIKGETYVYLVLMVLPALGLALVWCLWCQRQAVGRTQPSS